MTKTQYVLMKIDPSNSNLHEILKRHGAQIFGTYTFEDLSGDNPQVYFGVKIGAEQLNKLRDYRRSDSKCGIFVISSIFDGEDQFTPTNVKWAHESYQRDLKVGALA